MSIDYTYWLDHIKREYLNCYIPSGGASIRIAIGDNDTITNSINSLASHAKSTGYHCVLINTAVTRIQHIHNIYFEAANSIDWIYQTQLYAALLLDNRGIIRYGASLCDIDQLAALNHRDPRDMSREIKDIIYCDVTKNYAYCREFRWLLTALVSAVFFPSDFCESELDNLIAWATGHDCYILPLKKRFLIYQRISRSNARHMLRSLSAFLGAVNGHGLIVIIDATSLFWKRSHSETNPTIRYTKAAIIDTFGSFRCFIDDIDEFSNFALFVFCEPSLIDGGNSSVQELYTALYSRIVNEVHGSKRDNPLNLLVSLSSGDQEYD